MDRRIVGVAWMLAGCTEHRLRPFQHAELYEVAAVDGESALALFHHALAEQAEAGNHVTMLRLDGSIAWSRALTTCGPERRFTRPELFGGSAVLNCVDDVVLVRLRDGALSSWQGPSSGQVASEYDGDARQLFGLFTATRPARDASTEVELVAVDADDPAVTQWSTTVPVPEASRSHSWRADERHVLFHELGIGWHVLRREDGAEVATFAADEHAVCRAKDRWWASRGDRLLSVDLSGATPTIAEAPAEFIPDGLRWQWSIVDCAARGDEVILWADTRAGAVLTALDARTGRSRWTLPGPRSHWPDSRGLVREPANLGPALVMNYGRPCAIDLERGQIRGCVEEGDDFQVQRMRGGDALLAGRRDSGDLWLVQVDAEGTLVRGLELAGIRERASVLPRAGRLWLPGREIGDWNDLPSVTIDLGTFAPVGRSSPTITMGTRLPEWTKPRREPPLDVSPRATVDPLVHHYGPRAASGPAPAELRVDPELIRGFLDGSLDATSVRVVAWRAEQWTARHDQVLAFVEQPLAGGERRWIVLRLEAEDGRPQRHDCVKVVFRRRPTNHEVFRVLDKPGRTGGRPGGPTRPNWSTGSIDEEAWLALTGAPRTERWQLE